MEKMNLREKISFKGEWFLPSNEQLRLVGELTYDPFQGSRLEVHGNFSNSVIFPSCEKYDIIIGLVEGSRYITLYDVFLINSGNVSLVKNAETSIPNCIYCVNYFFVDCAIEKVEELSFTQANVHFHNLDEWVGISGFRKTYDYDLDKKKVAVQYKLPKPVKFNLPYEGIIASFNITLECPSTCIFTKNISLNQRTFFCVDSSSNVPLKSLQNIVACFQQFLILCTYQGTYIDSFTLRHKSSNKFVSFYFNSFPSDNYKTLLFYDLFIRYSDIRLNFPKILSRWYDLCDKMGGVLWLYTTRFLDEKHFSANDFLNMAQALESFHSLLYNHSREDESVFKNRLKRIINSVSGEDKDYIKDRLAQSNTLTLSERIGELVGKCSPDVLSIFIDDVDLFIKQIRDSRNYYTHYTKSGKKHILYGVDLAYLTDKIRLLLTCNILVYLKLSKKSIIQIFENKKHQFEYLKKATSSAIS
mgnify:CR=1 FL=1